MCVYLCAFVLVFVFVFVCMHRCVSVCVGVCLHACPIVTWLVDDGFPLEPAVVSVHDPVLCVLLALRIVCGHSLLNATERCQLSACWLICIHVCISMHIA